MNRKCEKKKLKNKMTEFRITAAAAINEKFQKFAFVFFAYNCILAHILDAVITVNTLAMKVRFKKLKDLPLSSLSLHILKLYISSVLANAWSGGGEIFLIFMIRNEK